jgi:2-amino-4-hydroxy-6-hydroxymethyldihydropteridine diphosphokinase
VDEEAAVVALGGNFPESREALREAVRRLGQLGRLRRVAPLYRTAPVGGAPQDRYWNSAVLLHAAEPPEALLERVLAIETRIGRVRTGEANAPRLVDIDLVAYGDRQVASASLTLPHPRAHLRRFVLEPWIALDPTARLLGRGLFDWWVDVKNQPVDFLAGPEWPWRG